MGRGASLSRPAAATILQTENVPMLSQSSPISFAATQNARKSREFYEKTLGLKFISEDGFALVFDANGTMLRIQKVEAVDPRGYTVLGWSVNDIKSEVHNLAGLGVILARYEGMGQDDSGIWTSPSGAKVAWFQDPDGNILSLTEF
jgi:catechol 2,3-dioxygenase-like lactoylglutathione lyase family enzyme